MRSFLRCSYLATLVVTIVSGRALAQSWVAVEDQLLAGSTTDAGDRFGSAVALSGDTLLVGAPYAGLNERGEAYVFSRANGAWIEQARLLAPPAIALDFDHFGASVAIEGDLAVVGAPEARANDSGAAFVYRRVGTAWTFESTLVWPAPSAQERFGWSVAIADSTVAVGAPRRSGIWGLNGAVGIFTGQGSAWTYRVRLSNPFADDDDQLGGALDLERLPSGRYGLIATSLNSSGVLYEGAGASWSYVDSIGGWSGQAVAREGTTAIVAEPFNNVPSGGRVLINVANASGYVLQKNLVSPSSSHPYNRFGRAIALDGDLLAVGETFDPNSNPGHGKVHVFRRSGTTWTAVRSMVLPGLAQADNFGWSLALEGSDLIVSAPRASTAAGVSAGTVLVLRIGETSATYCGSGISGAGCVARMSSSGVPSASLATPFVLSTNRVEAQRAGFIFYGVSGPTDIVWGASSVLCVKSPARRTNTQDSGGSAGACDGSFVLDWNQFVASTPTALGQPFSAGNEIFAQGWYRDPLSAKGFQLSNALAFILEP
jgi:hypothetical protein